MENRINSLKPGALAKLSPQPRLG